MQNLYETRDDFTKTLNETGVVAEILCDLKPATKLRFPNTVSHANKLLTDAITVLIMEPEGTSLPVAKANLKQIERLLKCVY